MASIARTIAVLSVVLIFAAAAPAQQASPQQAPLPYTDSTQIPDTPAYRRAAEIAALVNAADHEQTRAYVREHFAPAFRDAAPEAAHLGAMAQFRDQHGTVEPYSARSYTPARPATTATLILRGSMSESWCAIVAETEAEAPHRITGIRFSPARLPTTLPAAERGERLTDEQIAERLGAYVDRLAKAGTFSGTVLLARDGNVLVTRAVGLANRDFDAPNRLDTKFNLGSMNKMITAVAVAQLVEQGKLSFDDPVGKYLDESWLPREALEQIQVKHLLSHTSGLGSYFTDQFDRSSRALYRSVADYKPLVHEDRPAFTPGTDWRYSNTGFLIAGAVIEKVSGQDYFEYVRRNVTGPAGMTNTDSYELDRVNSNLAVGYHRERTPAGMDYRNNIFQHVLRGGPAGGGYSTVEDLLAFDRALRAGKLVSQAMLDQLWTAHPELASPEYGYGFGIGASPLGRDVGHTGGFTGISAGLTMYLDAGYTVAVLSNYSGAAALIDGKSRELLTQGR